MKWEMEKKKIFLRWDAIQVKKGFRDAIHVQRQNQQLRYIIRNPNSKAQ